MNSTLDPTIVLLIREVLPRRLHRTPLLESMSLRGDLGIDSIGLMSLAFRLEEEFRINLMEHTDEVANVQTIADVERLIHHIQRQQRS